MSQAKVDKYKKEKKNRAKNVKKARVKKVVNTLLVAAVIGIIIGFPLGKIMYNHYYDKKMEKATISTAIFDYWFQEYWDLHHAEKFGVEEVVDQELSDEQIDQLVDEISSASDSIVVTPEDLDQEALEEAIENASSSDAQ
ncbi:MAG: hypothetical protein E7263_00835 [Lachnospiraceae bacterium]|nr:hypothetical protein [Lachnospiraceae bacterium]